MGAGKLGCLNGYRFPVSNEGGRLFQLLQSRKRDFWQAQKGILSLSRNQDLGG